MDNALQESKLSYNQQAITDLFFTPLQYSSHQVNSKTCSQSSCFKVTHEPTRYWYSLPKFVFPERCEGYGSSNYV